MEMDKKEIKMFERYKSIIEKRTFDENDIYSFLIFIRRHINNNINYRFIQEFSDLVAHRKRDRGIVFDCIEIAISNNYQVAADGKTVIGYEGILYSDWISQWIGLGHEFGIDINEEIIEEITLCVFSLAQFTVYDDNVISGKIELFQGNDDSLALVTSENNSRSLYICFAKFGKFDFKKKYIMNYIDKPVMVVREDGVLRMIDENRYVI